jgi:hypothetical protein
MQYHIEDTEGVIIKTMVLDDEGKEKAVNVALDGMRLPDYSNRENINRITTGTWSEPISGNFFFTSNSWTADRTGFFVATLDMSAVSGVVWASTQIDVNGRTVHMAGSPDEWVF